MGDEAAQDAAMGGDDTAPADDPNAPVVLEDAKPAVDPSIKLKKEHEPCPPWKAPGGGSGTEPRIHRFGLDRGPPAVTKAFKVKDVKLNDTDMSIYRGGSKVQIVGLRKAAQLNGHVGRVIAIEEERITVDLGPLGKKHFRSSNLNVMGGEIQKYNTPGHLKRPDRTKPPAPESQSTLQLSTCIPTTRPLAQHEKRSLRLTAEVVASLMSPPREVELERQVHALKSEVAAWERWAASSPQRAVDPPSAVATPPSRGGYSNPTPPNHSHSNGGAGPGGPGGRSHADSGNGREMRTSAGFYSAKDVPRTDVDATGIGATAAAAYPSFATVGTTRTTGVRDPTRAPAGHNRPVNSMPSGRVKGASNVTSPGLLECLRDH